jgi:hypothetical protein
MSAPRKKTAARTKAKQRPAKTTAPKKAAGPQPKPALKPKAAPRPAAKEPLPKPPVKGKPAPAKGAPAPGGAPVAARPAKKSSRRSALLQRRGPDGQILAPGELLLPGGSQSGEEVQYLFRGVIATQKASAEVAVNEVAAKKQPTDPLANRTDLERLHSVLMQRFHQGAIEPTLPNRGALKRTFAGVIERAKQRRREIGSFLRGLDVGRPESSQMDSHGEASLQSLMEWSARLEKLADADEPAQGDYGQFHRGLDQLDHTTEALIVDVELTLRRLGGGRTK